MKAIVRLVLLVILVPLVLPAHAEVGEKRFNEAIRKGDLKRLARYLERGVSDEFERRALAYAVRWDRPALADLVLKYVEPDERIMDLALSTGRVSMIERLVSKGGRFTEKSTLWNVIRSEDEDLALAVLEAGERLHEPGPVAGLRLAEWADDHLILEKYRDEQGMNALYLAVEHDLDRLTERLLELGSDPNLIVHAAPGGVEGVDADAMAPGDRVRVAKSPPWTSEHFRTTALVTAVKAGRDDDALRLLDHGAVVYPEGATRDLNACSYVFRRTDSNDRLRRRLCPWTRLHDAVAEGRLAEIDAAVESGVDVNALDYEEWTALQRAVTLGRPEVVEKLLDLGADPNLAPGRFGKPPLHIAVFGGHVDLLAPLVKAGADIGGAVVHEAKNVETLESLIALGADIHAVDDAGRNALVRFNEFGAFEMIDRLRREGVRYPPEFGSLAPGVERSQWTSHQGHPKELVLIDVEDGTLQLGGQLSGGKNSILSCRLDDVVRDARYFHAPELVADRALPTPPALTTLTDDVLERYRGSIVRAGVVDGRCTILALPSSAKPDTATARELEAAVARQELRGDVFRMLTTGKLSAVFEGTLLSAADGIVLVREDGGLKMRCKLHEKTEGLVHGVAGLLDRSVFGGREIDPSDAVTDDDLARHVGKRVRIGPGLGRCEYFELLDAD